MTIGQFDHHEDLSIDFCLEVEAIEGILFDLEHRIERPGVDADYLVARVKKALEFAVPADPDGEEARRSLAEIERAIGTVLAPSERVA